MPQYEAARSDQLQEGALHVALVQGQSLALTRVGAAPQGFLNKCPHMGLSLTRGKLRGGEITCPFHGSRFDICSGANLDWVNSFMGLPLPKWTHGALAMGKKPAGLTIVPVREQSGTVFVELP